MDRRSWLLIFGVLFFVAPILTGCSEEEAAPTPVASSISPEDLKRLVDENAEILILDVRSRDEHANGHIAGAVNIPHTEIAARLEEVAQYRDKHVIVCCWAGGRADIAKDVLRNAGFSNLLDLRGHMAAWERLGYPIERGTS